VIHDPRERRRDVTLHSLRPWSRERYHDPGAATVQGDRLIEYDLKASGRPVDDRRAMLNCAHRQGTIQ
jgi:hypothetical protein